MFACDPLIPEASHLLPNLELKENSVNEVREQNKWYGVEEGKQ